jgi:hypothetical protein
MTTFTDRFVDTAKAATGVRLIFASTAIRRNAANNAIITPDPVPVDVATDGTFTTPDLEPGPTTVSVQWSGAYPRETYQVSVPASGTGLALWPLLEAAIPPGTSAADLGSAVAAYLTANPPSGGGSSLTITDNLDGTLTLNDGGSGALVDNNDGTFTLTV